MTNEHEGMSPSLADPLEAPAPADLDAARRDAYFTRGCGVETLKRDAELTGARRYRAERLEAMLADSLAAFDKAVAETREWADVAERAARVAARLAHALRAERGEAGTPGGPEAAETLSAGSLHDAGIPL